MTLKRKNLFQCHILLHKSTPNGLGPNVDLRGDNSASHLNDGKVLTITFANVVSTGLGFRDKTLQPNYNSRHYF